MKITETLNSYLGNAARPTKFNIIVNRPQMLADNFDRAVDVLAKNVTVPPITMETIDMKIKGHNLRIPGRVNQTQEITVRFYVDEKYQIRQIFQDWIAAMDPRYYGAKNENNKSWKGQDTYGQMLVIARDYEESNDKPMVYAFDGIYPISVGEMEYSADAKDTVMELEVTFAFYRFLHSSFVEDKYDEIDDFLDKFGKSAIGQILDGTSLGNNGMNIAKSGMNIAKTLGGLSELL